MSSKIEVSFVIQYFNHRDNIIPIVESIIGLWDGNEEIIFHNDSNSDHDIFEELCNRKPKLNEKIRYIVSDNIHEIRGYNKCIPECKGEYIFLMQDDDILNGKDWVKDIKCLFNKFSDLGIIGLMNGGMHNWGSFSSMRINNKDIEYKIDDIRFQFVLWANLAPFVVRKSIFEKIGYFDTRYSKKGESGIGLDSDITFKANLCNYFTGIMYFNNIERGVGGSGTKINPKKILERKTNKKNNKILFNWKYEKFIEKVHRRVNKKNKECLEKINK